MALRAKNELSSVSGREDLALRANNWLSSVSGREDFWHYVLKIGYPLFQAGKVSNFVLISLVYPLFFQAGKIFGITC